MAIRDRSSIADKDRHLQVCRMHALVAAYGSQSSRTVWWPVPRRGDLTHPVGGVAVAWWARIGLERWRGAPTNDRMTRACERRQHGARGGRVL